MPESQKVVPMIHVPDVRATVDWYESIGFKVLAAYGDDRRPLRTGGEPLAGSRRCMK